MMILPGPGLTYVTHPLIDHLSSNALNSVKRKWTIVKYKSVTGLLMGKENSIYSSAIFKIPLSSVYQFGSKIGTSTDMISAYLRYVEIKIQVWEGVTWFKP